MCLYKFIDIHLHNIQQVDRCGNFCYVEVEETYITDAYMPKVIMDVLPPCKPGKDKDKILHTLSKALPQRCQIRNLKDIIINYVSDDDKFFVFLLEVIKNSIFGTYEHCKTRLNFQGRNILYKSFIAQMSVKPFFCKWFRNGENHQVLIFFCLKEFLIHTVRQISPMYDVVDKMYGWSKFDTQVRSFMDKIRKMLNVIALREFTFMNRSDWISSVELVLVSAAKAHIKLFRTTPQLTYYAKIQSLLTKYFVSKKIFKVYDIINRDTTLFIWNVIKRLHNYEQNIFKIMHIYNIPDEVVKLLQTKTFAAEHFSKCEDRVLKYVIKFCRIITLRKNIGIYVLPQHIYDKQIEAMKRRENLTQLNTIDSSILGINYVCFICNDIKMFLMKTNCNSSRHSNKLAKGSLRVIVNNGCEHGELEYVCGRRTERHQRHGKRKWKDDNKIAERKLSKERQREAIAYRCVETPLQEISMLGHCLLYHNKLIHICTNCGNTCLINNQSFNYDVNLNCSMCIQTMKKKCEKCSNHVQCNNILALDTKTMLFRIAHICQSCTSIYAQVQPIKI